MTVPTTSKVTRVATGFICLLWMNLCTTLRLPLRGELACFLSQGNTNDSPLLELSRPRVLEGSGES
jgi:hypothetical protein